MPRKNEDACREWRARNPERNRKLVDNWRVANKEKRNAYARKWHAKKRAADPQTYAGKIRRSTLKFKYGITPEQYSEMLSAQGGHCALCDRTPAQERHKYLNVDHCHTTGRVRGLLCTKHNTALAAFGDDEAGLLRAAEYVRGGV